MLDAVLGALFAGIILLNEPLYEALLIVPVVLVLQLRDIVTLLLFESFYRPKRLSRLEKS